MIRGSRKSFGSRAEKGRGVWELCAFFFLVGWGGEVRNEALVLVDGWVIRWMGLVFFPCWVDKGGNINQMNNAQTPKEGWW